MAYKHKQRAASDEVEDGSEQHGSVTNQRTRGRFHLNPGET